MGVEEEAEDKAETDKATRDMYKGNNFKQEASWGQH